MELQHWSEVLISTLGWVGLDITGASLQNCNEGTWMYWMYFFSECVGTLDVFFLLAVLPWQDSMAAL